MLALNRDPPDLCLLSSWDYRSEPLMPGCLLASLLCFHISCCCYLTSFSVLFDRRSAQAVGMFVLKSQPMLNGPPDLWALHSTSSPSTLLL
jgi:hypothetical protein